MLNSFLPDLKHSKIALRTEDLALVRAILQTHIPHVEVRAFGSRVAGTPKPTSDLDLCVMTDDPIPERVLEGLRIAFAESRLPFRVDVVEWRTLSDGFREIISRDFVNIHGEAG